MAFDMRDGEVWNIHELQNKLWCSLYISSYKHVSLAASNLFIYDKKIKERERELTVLASKSVDGMKKTVMEIRSPSETRHL